ncbi:hypothetical protein INR49_002715 [Caranx melampygus]|nr:hypothetical protein INR49_002715 [Caranx melampygus]
MKCRRHSGQPELLRRQQLFTDCLTSFQSEWKQDAFEIIFPSFPICASESPFWRDVIAYVMGLVGSVGLATAWELTVTDQAAFEPIQCPNSTGGRGLGCGVEYLGSRPLHVHGPARQRRPVLPPLDNISQQHRLSKTEGNQHYSDSEREEKRRKREGGVEEEKVVMVVE